MKKTIIYKLTQKGSDWAANKTGTRSRMCQNIEDSIGEAMFSKGAGMRVIKEDPYVAKTDPERQFEKLIRWGLVECHELFKGRDS